MNFKYHVFSTLFLVSFRTVLGTFDIYEDSPDFKDINLFISYETRIIGYSCYQKISKACCLENSALRVEERIAFYQGKNFRYYCLFYSEDNIQIQRFLKEMKNYLVSQTVKNTIIDRVRSSQELMEQIKKRFPANGIFRNPYIFVTPTHININFEDFMREDVCIKRLKDLFIDSIARKIVDHYGVEHTINDEFLDWYKYSERKKYCKLFSKPMRKEFDDYVESEDFNVVVNKMIGFMINYYKTSG